MVNWAQVLKVRFDKEKSPRVCRTAIDSPDRQFRSKRTCSGLWQHSCFGLRQRELPLFRDGEQEKRELRSRTPRPPPGP